MQKLTKEQAIIISAYTGYTACNFSDMHYAVQQKLDRHDWEDWLTIPEKPLRRCLSGQTIIKE